MNKVTLLEEFRLIERCESEVNSAWRGAHLLLFFLAFVFGSFCTFCFHMLMYLFDEKCVLFPKLLSLSSTRHNVIYEFIPNNKDIQDLPVDFLSTQWVEKNACTLPTYVPLLSGIFGLVWTTMFLMCSTGSRTLTGLQRPWRVLPPVFLFSLAMGSLCVYSSAVTHYGLQELCYKLGEITGSSTCTYTVNVATLAYERRIRGVYQATRLTILTAWLHTACWVLSALLALARVLLAVDFQLVRVNVDLRGDIDKMLQRHEQQIRTVSPDPDLCINDENQSVDSHASTRVHFNQRNRAMGITDDLFELQKQASDLLFFSNFGGGTSELSLVPAERKKLDRLPAYKNVSKDKRFIVDILYDILDSISVAETIYKSISAVNSSSSILQSESESTVIIRQIGQQKISSETSKQPSPESTMSSEEAEVLATEIKQMLQMKLNNQLIQLFGSPTPPSTPKTDPALFKSTMDIADELRLLLDLADSEEKEKYISNEDKSTTKKSNLKTVGVQTDKPKGRVQISKSATNYSEESISDSSDKTKDKDVEEDVIQNIEFDGIEKEDIAKTDVENHDTDEMVVREEDVEIVEEDTDKTVFEKDANIVIKEDTDVEFLNNDQWAIAKSGTNLEEAELEAKVVNKENADLQDDGIVEFVIDIDKEKDDDEEVNTESFGEVTVSVEEEVISEVDTNKQTQTKPKEKQD